MFGSCVLTAASPTRGSAWSMRSLCDAARIVFFLGEPYAGIGRVDAFSLWRRASCLTVGVGRIDAHLRWRRTTCLGLGEPGDRACPSDLVVAPCEHAECYSATAKGKSGCLAKKKI